MEPSEKTGCNVENLNTMEEQLKVKDAGERGETGRWGGGGGDNH